MQFKLVVGLGNPGPEHERTYHNAGQLLLDHITHELGVTWKHEAAYAVGRGPEHDGQAIRYIKPATFMNESGRAVQAAARYFKVPPARIIVLHDDADMTVGTWKVRHGGGSGGHRGIASIIEALGDSCFWRLKLGIRPAETFATDEDTGHPRVPALDLVLRPIGAKEWEALQGVFGAAAKSLVNVIENEMP